MKKVYLLGLMILFAAVLTSCRKNDDGPTSTRFKLPDVSLISAGDLNMKAGYVGTDLINKLTYEFYVKNVGSTTWIPMPASVFTHGSGAYTQHENVFTLAYPGAAGQGFIDIPQNITTRLVIKGTRDGGPVQFYGVQDFTTTSSPDNHVVPLYEVNARLNFDVEQLLLLTEYSFDFTITTVPADITWASRLQTVPAWIMSNAGRSSNTIPGDNVEAASTYVLHVSGDIPVADANGHGTLVKTVTLSKNGGAPVALPLSTTSTNTIGSNWRNLFTVASKSSLSNTTVTTAVTRKHVGNARPQTGTVIMPTPVGAFNPANWCQAGYNFNIVVTANPDALATGNFSTTFTLNTEVDGTIHFGN